MTSTRTTARSISLMLSALSPGVFFGTGTSPGPWTPSIYRRVHAAAGAGAVGGGTA